MRILTPRIHFVLDLLFVAVFALAPLLIGLGGTPALISYVLALVHLVVTLLTRFPPAAVRPIPLFVHGLIELAVSIGLVLLPFWAGYSPGSPARRYYVTVGAVLFVVWLLTDYRAPERRIQSAA